MGITLELRSMNYGSPLHHLQSLQSELVVMSAGPDFPRRGRNAHLTGRFLVELDHRA